MNKFHVIKRNGQAENLSLDKITIRIQNLCFGLDHVIPEKIAIKVSQGVYDGISTSKIDELSSETAAYMIIENPEYSILAARISVSNLKKKLSRTFSETIQLLYHHVNSFGKHSPLISHEVYEIVQRNTDRFNSEIVEERDYHFDYFAFKTMEQSYLLKINHEISETPQYMFMRVAIGIHKENIDDVIQTYHLMTQKFFTHATPTLFNSGTPNPQMSSCYLLKMREDSIDGIYDTLKQCAIISKFAGGIGMSIHNIRANGSNIQGTNGVSNGIIPMLRVFNETARYVDQGGGKRKGAFAIYLEPWHVEIFEFLNLRKNHGTEHERTRDLFTGLWVSDLFMRRVKDNGSWSLFCPNEAPGLQDCWGVEFEELYLRYECEGRARRTIDAQILWKAIITSQIETGTPYMLYKDTCNRKSNQQNLGTIQTSNLCTEIVQFTANDEIAVCNLASINLSAFVTNQHEFDFERLYHISKIVTRNLNKVVDNNFYPLVEAKNSNMRHRPIGIGVQGLADAFCLMKFPYESLEARQLNRDIFETIYFGACEASNELAQCDGPYSTFEGSPASKGQLQFDLWGITPSTRWDWSTLKIKIQKYGLRNSLLVSPMPTASTAQILGNNESFEPFTTNLYTRRVLSGEFIVINKHLVRDLIERNLWDKEMQQNLIRSYGSVQKIDRIPDDLKALYKTVWEIPQKACVQMAVDRGPFICQSQSLNIHMENATFQKVTSLHFFTWQQGLKTGLYYLRTQPKANAIQFTVECETCSA